ncbi:hypothetical protein K7X08_032115 [Anisodus acutangulus]|uniref:Uncharacterized protein n=1 Tax=Anisodus acutangulus TaxID=402998 RepID=A0A9Q1MQX7_9SOLA|nr:hypothetical protein K7X08_032115 [Anisodus acutangulus]
MVPARFYFVGSFPMSSSGKVDLRQSSDLDGERGDRPHLEGGEAVTDLGGISSEAQIWTGEREFGNGDKNTGKQANPANTGGGTAVITSSGQSGVMKRKDLSNIPLSEQVSGSPTPDEAQKGKAVANETVTNVTIPLTATTIARYEPQSVTNTNVVANTSNTQG